MDLVWIDQGGVTSPRGFVANGVATGIKTYGVEPRFDVGVLTSTRPCAVAGVFTRNQVCGAPVELCRERVGGGIARGVVVNSGCSNVAMGERGRRDARKMAEIAARHLGLPEQEMLVAS